MPGAVQVITAKDIPKNGENNFLPLKMLGFESEPVSVYKGHSHSQMISEKCS